MTLHWKRRHSVESLDDETSIELTVLRQHWKQILQIFKKPLIDQDDITCVVSHFQHAVTLLTNEVASHDRPGPILLYFIAESILDTFFVWSLSCPEYASELKYHQLRCYEFLLSRSQHELLFHKQIFKPLLNLLRSCESTTSLEFIEKHMIVVLNQICVSITKTPDLLDFCFDISAEHGPSKFIIFSLLIPFVHRDGVAGQQARDALLLIMQLSNRNEHIAKYIVENTNFCPILATGLSALYSELPHRLATNNEEWFLLTKQDWSENEPLVQFMNSLQFCNDVVQIAHPLIGQHLLQFIYHGFLVPVLGPSIYQDLHEIPIKFSDLQQISNTLDEVIAATAYLDLFLRSLYEPTLLKIFLKFILCVKIDEVSLLDTLIDRINFTTKLGLVSLSLFHTLVNLNCEDIMYRLIFMYLIPCRHVMHSQRRHIADIEIYGKNAEKFLTLQPSFSNRNNDINSHKSSSKKARVCFDQDDNSNERYDCTFASYLADAHFSIVRCRLACRCWTAPYNGETPSSDTVVQETDILSLASSISSLNTDNNNAKQLENISNPAQSLNLGKTVAISNDSGIHVVDGHESNSQTEQPPKLTAQESFKLPYWLANNQPIPDELLMNHSTINHSAYHYEHDNDDDSNYYQNPSSFYAFSFIDIPGENEDTWSLNSSNAPNTHIRDEIKTCVESIHNCLDHFREMNEQKLDMNQNLDDEIVNLLNDLLNQIETSTDNHNRTNDVDLSDLSLDCDLLNDLFTKTLTFQEYLSVLDQLVDKKYIQLPTKKGEDLSNEIVRLSEEIERCRTVAFTDHTHQTDLDSQYNPQASFNIQSNYSVMSFLPQSTSMDISCFMINDLTNQAQSTLFTNSVLQQQTTTNGKPADIGPFLRTIFGKLENMLHNSLYVNLLLTGIISRLAQYSQPLLRSLLLNHSLVLETNVKSLFQILSNLKSKLETISHTFNDFNYLVQCAHEALYQREKVSKEFDEIQKRARSPSRTRSKSVEPNKNEERVLFEIRSVPLQDQTSKRSRILDFFRGRSRATERTESNTKERGQSQITFIDRTSMKFINVRDNHQQNLPIDEWDDPKTRNIAYCAVIFNEFLKELAAITLEHSVQQFDDDKIFDDLPLTQILF